MDNTVARDGLEVRVLCMNQREVLQLEPLVCFRWCNDTDPGTGHLIPRSACEFWVVKAMALVRLLLGPVLENSFTVTQYVGRWLTASLTDVLKPLHSESRRDSLS